VVTSDVLTLEGVTKRYGTHSALSRVSFTLRSGEAVGYLGPNGAGKSTTLKILCGLIAPDEGHARVLGEDPRAPGGAARQHLGALVETPGLAPYLHGRDLLEYVAEIKGFARADRPGEIRRVAEEMEIPEHLDRPVGGLSTGLLRRLLLAGALVGAPALLLLDEPTLGLDPAARRDLRASLRKLHARGTTILLSTHLLDDVEEVCGRVLFLRDGRLVGDEPVGPESGDGSGTEARTVRLGFRRPVDPALVLRCAGEGAEILGTRGTEVSIRIPGGEARQAELLAALVRAELPIASARSDGRSLTDRYLSAVGREDEG
jgi:ABC-2 type transport system ATP-binding protein